MRGSVDCEVCGEFTTMPYQCNHCGGTHCSEHQLPENHNCPATNTDSSDQWFSGPSPQESRRAVSQGETDPPDPMDSSEIRTYGTADEPVGESSPDVALDGSVQREEKSDETQDTSPRLATRIMRRLQHLF